MFNKVNNLTKAALIGASFLSAPKAELAAQATNSPTRLEAEELAAAPTKQHWIFRKSYGGKGLETLPKLGEDGFPESRSARREPVKSEKNIRYIQPYRYVPAQNFNGWNYYPSPVYQYRPLYDHRHHDSVWDYHRD